VLEPLALAQRHLYEDVRAPNWKHSAVVTALAKAQSAGPVQAGAGQAEPNSAPSRCAATGAAAADVSPKPEPT
jgi:hypothetical protein